MSYYNTKIIRTSSYVEIYEYSKPISKRTKDDNSIILINDTNEITDKTNDKSKSNEEDSIRRMALTRKRSKAELVRLIDTNYDNRTSFLTLTVKENIINRLDSEKFSIKNNTSKQFYGILLSTKTKGDKITGRVI